MSVASYLDESVFPAVKSEAVLNASTMDIDAEWPEIPKDYV